jgi:hypothetical protein
MENKIERERREGAVATSIMRYEWTSSTRFSPSVMKEEELGVAPEVSVRHKAVSGEVW